MDFLDAFQILGLKKSASEEEIRAAYRKLAKQWHPDINKEPEAEETFKRINQAYDLLTKPKIPSNSQTSFNDPFFERWFGRQEDDFFGGLGGFHQPNTAVKSASITFELEDISQQVADEIAQIIAEKGLKII